MPKRLKVLIAAFLVVACTNAGSAIVATYRHRDPVWVARSTLAIGVAGLFGFCAWLIWRKKPGAAWFPAVYVGCVMAMAKGPFLYGFFTMLSHRSSGTFFAPDVHVHWIHACVYILLIVATPVLLHRLLVSKKSAAWLQSAGTTD